MNARWSADAERYDKDVLAFQCRYEGGLIGVVYPHDFDIFGKGAFALGAGDDGERVLACGLEGGDEVGAEMTRGLGVGVRRVVVCGEGS